MAGSLKKITMIVCFLCYGKLLHAQQSIDSVQKVLMHDSLGLCDNLIAKVVELRQGYFQKAIALRSDTSLNDEQRQAGIKLLRSQTNSGIKILLGEQVFEKYKQMIHDRIKRHSMKGEVLASDGN